MGLKPKDKVTVDGRVGTVVRVLKDENEREIVGVDVEVDGVIDRYDLSHVQKV